MVDKLAKKGQKAGLRLVTLQLLIVLLTALILTVFFSVKTGYSGLAGGITFLLPNFIFVLMAFAHAGASKSRLVVRGVLHWRGDKALSYCHSLYCVFEIWGGISTCLLYFLFIVSDITVDCAFLF